MVINITNRQGEGNPAAPRCQCGITVEEFEEFYEATLDAQGRDGPASARIEDHVREHGHIVGLRVDLAP